MIHIDTRHLEIIKKILAPYHQEFYVFGSRATGKHRPLSDVDILSKVPLTKLQVSEINEHLEESDLPYKVDLVLWNEIEDSFKDKIQSDLKKIF